VVTLTNPQINKIHAQRSQNIITKITPRNLGMVTWLPMHLKKRLVRTLGFQLQDKQEIHAARKIWGTTQQTSIKQK
jgi:hypothetical protein